MSGTPSPKESSSSGSAASFIKVVQSLIQSDDEEIISKKMAQLQGSFPVLKKITQATSNQEKLTLFTRDNNFKHRIQQKLLENFGIQKMPTIKVQLYTIRHRSNIEQELDESDLIKIFSRFGKISFIYADKTFAYIQFQSLIASYLAIKTLNEFEVVPDILRMSVRWSKQEQQAMAEQFFLAKFNSITKAFGSFQKEQKFNCKYVIQLACPVEFKLTQKIIGPKGNNMKKIFEVISNQHKIASIKQCQKNLKMRLRGKGSGYAQGPNGQQSEETLNLCISSKQKDLYDSACQQVQTILERLTKDYKYEYERSFKRGLQGTSYKKYELQSNNYMQTKQLRLEHLSSQLHQIVCQENKKLTDEQIQDQINLRNKARKMGKYQQADQIRQKLKNKGIVVVDGTGRKNGYKTAWNYIG